jgi:hypothetical protein
MKLTYHTFHAFSGTLHYDSSALIIDVSFWDLLQCENGHCDTLSYGPSFDLQAVTVEQILLTQITS